MVARVKRATRGFVFVVFGQGSVLVFPSEKAKKKWERRRCVGTQLRKILLRQEVKNVVSAGARFYALIFFVVRFVFRVITRRAWEVDYV